MDRISPALPTLRRVQIVGGIIRALYTRKTGRHGQRRLADAYQKARFAISTDGRTPQKQGAVVPVVGPVLDFVNLEPTPEAAVAFTRRFGPLTFGSHQLRLLPRPLRRRERPRGVTSGQRVFDQMEWTLPLKEFYRQQRRFRLLLQLAEALTRRSPKLPTLLCEALTALPEIACALAGTLHHQESLETQRNLAIERVEAATECPLRLELLLGDVGDLVAKVLTAETPKQSVTYRPEEGFSQGHDYKDVKDLLYTLLVQELPAYRSCVYCGRFFYQNRPDKNTCDQRCAMRWSKREWARKHRASH